MRTPCSRRSDQKNFASCPLSLIPDCHPHLVHRVSHVLLYKSVHRTPPRRPEHRRGGGDSAGGRPGGVCEKRAPEVQRGSAPHGQSCDSPTKRSPNKIAGRCFAASRASL